MSFAYDAIYADEGLAGGNVRHPTLRARAVAALTRLYPFYSGCGKLANLPLVQRLVGDMAGDAWVSTQAGQLYAPLDDSIGRSIFLTGDYDRKINALARRIVREGDVAVDVGANFGLVTTTLSRLVGAAGAVHAFEPNPAVARYLRRTLTEQGHSGVTLHPVALGPQETTLTLAAPLNNTGGGSLKFEGDDKHDSYNVPVRRLDAMLPLDTPVSLMKVDVEGFEREVFEGARGKLENGSVGAVLFEEHGRCDETHTPDTVAFFDDLPYDVFGVPRCMMWLTLTPLAEKRARNVPARDYLAIARTPATAAMRRRLGVA